MFLPKVNPILWGVGNGNSLNKTDNENIDINLDEVKANKLLPLNHYKDTKHDYIDLDGLLYIYIPGLPEIKYK